MREMGLGVVAVAVACGGSDNTVIDGGPGDGTTGDVAQNDTGAIDSGGDASPDSGMGDGSDGGGFNPSTVLGLVLWLKGDLTSSITTQVTDAGVTKVARWADQTSHHNDANALNQFLSSAPTIKNGAINSLPAVHFDQGTGNGSLGEMLTIADNADTSLQWGMGDFFVVIVSDFDNNPSNGQQLGVGDFYSKLVGSGGSGFAGIAFYGNVPSSSVNPTAGLYFGTAATAGNFLTTGTAYNTGAPHMFALRRRSGTLDLIVDGTSVANATGSNVDVSAMNATTCLGAHGNPAVYRLDGDIGEILAVKGVLASSDEAGIVGYLKGKWATP